ncbi:MAG: hypothetical protein VX501_07165 [Pseudomonadota bacterium]|nr:hypothetical protein [Pseudomonadota bacterium]
MGRSNDHSQMPTHAHIMLLGGVLSVLWAIVYRVFGLKQGFIAWIQTVSHHAGAVIMISALYMMYGQMAPESQMGPLLGIAALLAMVSVVLMFLQALTAKDG